MLYRHRVLVGLFFLSMLTYLDRICLSVAGPRMQEELGISPENWGWVVGVFAVSYGAFEIPGGALADRFGARRMLTRIVLWWSSFTVLTGMVSSLPLLLVTRFLFGAGEAGAFPGMSSSVSRWFPTTERAGAQAVIWTASRIGAAISPLIVIPIQQTYGWRASFYVFGALGVVWAILWFWWYRDHPAEVPQVSPEERHAIDGGAAPQPHTGMPWRIVLKQPNYWKILAMYHTYSWAGFFYLAWLHTYLQKGRHLSEDEMKIFSVLPFVVGACGNLFGGFLSGALCRRYGLSIGRRSVGTVALVVGAACLLIATQTGNKYVAVGCLTLGYGAMDCMLPVAWAVCLDVGGKYTGSVTGSMNMAGQVGGFFSSIVFGYMVAIFADYNTAMLPLVATTLASAVIFWTIDPNRPLVQEMD